jgi:glucan phosphoethanolaminetransferase (alkaline phosphatase superfamily)
LKKRNNKTILEEKMKKGINVLVILFVLFSFVFITSCGKDNDSIQDEMNNKINLINDKIANNESYFNEKINSLTSLNSYIVRISRGNNE